MNQFKRLFGRKGILLAVALTALLAGAARKSLQRLLRQRHLPRRRQTQQLRQKPDPRNCQIP